MKKNTFKYTFYFGLLIIFALTGLLTAISINLYKSFSNKISIKKQEDTIVEVPLIPDREIIHDTIYFEKPITKILDTSKPKKSLIRSVSIETTDTILNDSLR